MTHKPLSAMDDAGRKATRRTEERLLWLLRLLTEKQRRGFVVAWDEDIVDDFVAEFPEAERSLKIYTLGPNLCPMLNRTAALAKRRGFIEAGHVGNQDARSFNQRTWSRTWSITDAGRAAILANQCDAEIGSEK